MNEKSGPAAPDAASASDLRAEELRGRDLRGQDLTKVEGLLPEHLAGADLTRAKLPDEIDKFPALEQVKAISAEARKIFIGLLAACVYSWLVIGTTTDVALILNTASSPLPIINTAIPIAGFYMVGAVSSPRSTATCTSTCSGCGGRSRPCPRSSRTAWPSTTRPTPGCSPTWSPEFKRLRRRPRRSRVWRMLAVFSPGG